jgi:hypothetical protein
VSLVALVAISAYPIAAADRFGGLIAAGGAAAVTALALGLVARFPFLVAAALAVAGAEQVAVLYVGADARPLPLVAGTLVVVAELAYWALEREPGRGARLRAATVVGAAVGGGAAAALIASISNEEVTGGVGLLAGGVAAAVTAIAVVVGLGRATSR